MISTQLAMDLKEKYEFRNFRNQFFAVFSANLISFSHGCIIGWVTPALMLLTSDETPLSSGPITLEELSWIGSMNSIGAMLGTFSFGCFTTLIGCKRAMTFLALPAIGYWVTIVYGDSANWIIFARFLAGWCGGGILSISVLYVAEIADPKIRGTLGSITHLCRNVGMLTSYVLGAFLDYNVIPYVFIVIPVVYMINFIFLPNTPQYLVKRGQFEKAECALQFYKACKGKTVAESAALSNELEKMKNLEKQHQIDSKLHLNDFLERTALRAIVIAITLSCMKAFTGCFIFLTYAGRILTQTGTTIDPYKSAICFGIVQIAGSLSTTQLADRFGRKVLLITSLVGTILGQISLSLFTFLQELDYDVSFFSWMPVISICFVIFISTLGVIPLASVCTVEALPAKIRTIGMMINILSLNVSAFLLGKFFPIMSEIIGLHGFLWFLSGGCICAIIFIIFFMEETRGRNLDSIGSKSQGATTNSTV